jgi:hypothetical protein
MTLSAEQTRPIRLFEVVNLISAAALMAAAVALGKSALLPGAVAGALAAAVNVRLTRIVIERFLQSESKDQSAVLALLGIKVIVVLACVVGLVYLRPDLAAGMALGFTSILPASLVLAVNYAFRRLD